MRHNILRKNLAALLFSMLGTHACYANNPVKIVDAYLYESNRNGISIANIGEDLLRANFGAPRKCGIPTLTLFDKKDGNHYENQDVQLISKPTVDSCFSWILINPIKNTKDNANAKFYTITFDGNPTDPDCATKSGTISNLEMSPYVFSTDDEIKKITIKNGYSQTIEITSIKNMDKKGYVTPPQLSEPIQILPGETYDFELQAGVCPPDSSFLPKHENIQFSYKNIVDGNSLENVFNIKIKISCDNKPEQTIDENAEETHQEKVVEENPSEAQKKYTEATAKAKKTKHEADTAQKEAMDAAVKAAVKKTEQKAEKAQKKAVDAAVKETKQEAAEEQKNAIKTAVDAALAKAEIAQKKAIDAAVKKAIKEEEALRKQAITEGINKFKQEYLEKQKAKKTKKSEHEEL